MNRLSFALVSLPLLALSAACFGACSSNKVITITPDGGGEDASASDDDADVPFEGGAGTQCSSARDQLLLPIKKVSTGEVSVVAESGGVTTIYVDASAGGQGASAKNPRVYVNLSTGTRVDVTDEAAEKDPSWDLSLKRTVVFTNSGDAGIGIGGAAQLSKAFDSVTAADADAAKIQPESFFDEECNPKLDPIGAPDTTFSDWYDYDQATNIPTPKNLTFIVKGGMGKRFKVAITAYDGLPDGGTRNNQSTGFFILKVAEL